MAGTSDAERIRGLALRQIRRGVRQPPPMPAPSRCGTGGDPPRRTPCLASGSAPHFPADAFQVIRVFRVRMIRTRWAGLAVDRPTFADEFVLAVAVAIGDARRRFTQDDAECDARAGYALFTNSLHAGNSGSGNTGNRFVFSRGKRNDYRGTERRYADIAIGRFVGS